MALCIKLDNANIVHKVTIIPRGNAGGYALMLPEEEESFLMTKQSLLDQVTGLLGGRFAEELIFNEMSTGAHNDFQKATEITRAMVTEYGMSSLDAVSFIREKRRGALNNKQLRRKPLNNRLRFQKSQKNRSQLQHRTN